MPTLSTLALALLLILPACQTGDPGLAALNKLEDIYDNQTMAFSHLVNDPQNNMTPEVRKFYQDGIANNGANWKSVKLDFMDWLGSLGIDYKAAFEQARESYEAIRAARR